MEALRAAVQNGANAVYLGCGAFNARQSAKNFTLAGLAEAVKYCHVRGVDVHLTLNTLVSDNEMKQACDLIAAAARCGVDAFIVQDLGVAEMCRSMAPGVAVHGSTQMTVHNLDGVLQCAAMGMSRVVVSRELSREEIRYLCSHSPIEIEVFVHGALCMCYSGQCYLSAAIGGRSGNRGRCAQPCRMPYGVNEPAGKKYPLSLKDSCLAHELQAMEDMGVACLKLEGRMKRPEYVAVITRIYARLLREGRDPTSAEETEMAQAFSRSGFTDWYWQGKHGPEMFGTRPENAPEPKALFDEARAAYERGDLRTVPVRFDCEIRAGAPCLLTVSDRDGHTVTVTGAVPEAARNRSITASEIEERLRKTGGTAFRCENAVVRVDEGLALAASAVNALRRDGLSALEAARTAPPERRELALPVLPELDCSADMPQFTVSVVNAAQLTGGLLDLHPARTYVPLELMADFPALPIGDTEWCAVLPRVWRDRDEPRLREMLERVGNLGVRAVAVGNIGHLSLIPKGWTAYGDFGLNVFNGRSLDYLRKKGLSSACLSFELRFAQMRDLPKILPTEAIVYGRLPLMVTENCLIQNSVGCRCDRPNFLNDRTGAAFPLLPVFGHRTEVQNSKPLWLADRADYKRLGLAYARLRFTTETPEECVRVYRGYLEGTPATGAFTRGLYERGVE